MKTSLFTCVIATLAVISANAQTPTPAPTPTAPGRVGGGSVTPVRPVPRGATPGAVNPGTVPGGNPLNPLPGSLIAPVAGNPPGASTAQGANNNAQGANAGASNSVAFNGTNGPGLTISNNVFVTNLFGFNTNMLGVFSNRDNLANGIGLGNSNSQAFAGPNNAIVNGSNAVLERVGNKLMGKFITTNTPSSQGMIQDLALTPTDQAIISRVRQVVQPQNNTVNSGSVTPVHLVVQNGVVTLLGNVQNVGEKQRLGNMIQRIPGVTRVVDQLTVASTSLGGTGSALPGTIGPQTNLTPTGRLLSNGVPSVNASGSNNVSTDASFGGTASTAAGSSVANTNNSAGNNGTSSTGTTSGSATGTGTTSGTGTGAGTTSGAGTGSGTTP